MLALLVSLLSLLTDGQDLAPKGQSVGVMTRLATAQYRSRAIDRIQILYQGI